MKRERGIERISQHVIEIIMGQSLSVGKSVRMHHDEGPELFCLGEERPEFRIGKFLAVDIGQDLDALQFQRSHDVVELADRDLGFLQRDDAKPHKPVGLPRAKLRDPVVGEAVSGFGDFRIDRIIALVGRRCDELNIDTHSIEVGQAAIDRGHYLANVVLLLDVVSWSPDRQNLQAGCG